MKNENRFCLYFHFTADTHQVFYVGIGSGYRPRRFTGRNKMWERIVKKHGFYAQVMFNGLTWGEAGEMEKKYIRMFGKRSLKQGPLANLTDGGDGAVGCISNVGSKRTPEQRQRISVALKGRKVDPEAVANSVAAKKKNREERLSLGIVKPKRVLSGKELQRIRTMNIGRKRSPELNKRHSEMMKGRKAPPKVIEALRLSNLGVPKSEEHKKRLSESTKRQWEQKRTWYYQL
jgi:hypothetical protein